MIFWPSVAIAYAKKRELQALFSNPSSRVAKIAETLGCGQAMFVYGSAALIAAAITRDPKLRVFARAFAKRGLLGAAIFEASRFVLAERRPKQGGEMRFFARHGHGVSGHAFAAALLRGPIMEAWGPSLSPRKRGMLSASLYAWIAFIAWSRVALDEHFVWNTLLGAKLGLRVGK